MNSRRQRRKSRNIYILDNLELIYKVLTILIIICLVIFIFSAIKVKKSTFGSEQSKLSETNITENTSEDFNKTMLENFDFNNFTLENTSSKETTDNSNKSTTINLAFTGDIMCHNTIYNDALDKASGIYDFSHIFENVKYHIQTADIAVGNLETTFSGADKGYSSYPTFNTPESLAYNLKKIGFDVLSTANNHCYDFGYDGIESTINYLDDADIAHTGTYKSENAQNTILVKNAKGLEIAFLSFTYGTNGITIPSDRNYSVNLTNEETVLHQLSLAKELNPDLICVNVHWGDEYKTTPNADQVALADLLFKNGADIIIGSHPHVLQPMEKREITLDDGTIKDGFIVYSLGNFLADQNKNYTRDSVILKLKITKSSEGKININSATYTPIYNYKNNSKTSQKFSIIDLQNTIDSYEANYDTSIGPSLYNTFKTELNNIKNIIGEEIK